MEYQPSLFDASGNARAAPVPALVDSRLPKESQPRLSRQAEKILRRLESGPATNMDLIPIATRFSARIHDLRKCGYIIETDMIDRQHGITRYTLKGKR